MKYEISKHIPGVALISPDIFYDFRGEFVETYNAQSYSWITDKNGRPVSFIQDDISVSSKNVLRGLHGDYKTFKLVQCAHGDLYLVIVDFRKESSNYLQWESYHLDDKKHCQVIIPPGCANGHLCLSDKCIFSYKQSSYYEGQKAQFTLRWNDPKLNITWPCNNPRLSSRDASAKML